MSEMLVQVGRGETSRLSELQKSGGPNKSSSYTASKRLVRLVDEPDEVAIRDSVEPA